MLELYQDFIELASPFFTRFVVGLIILLAGFIIAKLVGKLVRRLLHSLDLNVMLQKITGTNIALEEIAESFTTYFLYFITIVMVLQHLGLATTVLNMIAGAIIIIIVLSTFLGIKDFIPNIIAGIVLRQKDFLKVGDVIKVKGMKGRVVEITFLETKIETTKKDMIFIPNSVLIKTEIVKVQGKE
ncbi:hypothetical protein D6774_02570 [Candidatus Woesearchaeota archaeon]|nr:MAG: hypothetical protein D6774_02570 [Candidatus Woesearchaeota archaeon]